MKCSVLAILLPSAALAFAPQPATVRRATAVQAVLPDNFSRARECATHYGECSLDEMERLEQDLNQFQASENQGHDDYQDTKEVRDMLRLEVELQSKQDEFEREHQRKKEYVPPADNWQMQTPPGLGLGLW
ncbi:hypothetical protein ACHAXT_011398 [Thalassiosira profunda]